MRIRLIVALILLLPIMGVAQSDGMGGARLHPQSDAAAGPTSGFALPGGFKAPEGLLDDFWSDPAMAAELRLSDAQRRQLQDAALTQRLSLVDSGAEILKGFLKVSASLDAEPFNEAAYKKHLDELAASTGKAVQNVGEIALAPRRVLTPEQWAKLKVLRKAKQATARAATTAKRPAPVIPHSLEERP
jgi:Spy/CpxP family protein refolding chaperone